MQLLLRGFIFKIIFTGVNFLVSLLIAKLAGTFQFGLLSLMIINASILQIITGMGTDAAIVWHGASGKIADGNKMFSISVSAVIIQLFLFAAIESLFFVFTNKSLLTGSNDVALFAAECLYFCGLVLTEKFSALFYSRQQAVIANRILAFVSLFLLLLIIFAWLFNPGLIEKRPLWIFSLYIFIPAVVLIGVYQQIFRPIFVNFEKTEIKSFIDFSVIVFITNLVQFIAYRADYWFINYFHQKADVGVYAQAAKFAQVIWIIPGILAGLMVPALKNEKQKLETRDFLSFCRTVFFSHLAIALALILISFLIYSLFLPADYFNGFTSVLLMLPGYIFFTITIMLAAWFSANRILKINLLGSLVCLLSILMLDWLLIPDLSYKGAAIANLVAYSGTTFFFILTALPYLKVRMKDFFTVRKSDFKLYSKKIISPGTTIDS